MTAEIVGRERHAQANILRCEAQSAVEFPAALFHEASKQQDP
jgi:hypothetical protein